MAIPFGESPRPDEFLEEVHTDRKYGKPEK
jgi:hypothetical protein